MDVYELRSKYYQHNPHGHYFDWDTLKWFGERMSEMYVRKEPVTITDIDGQKRKCWMLSKYSRKHPMGPRRTYAYFDVETFEDVVR